MGVLAVGVWCAYGLAVGAVVWLAVTACRIDPLGQDDSLYREEEEA